MAVSPKLRQLVRDAILGYTHAEVIALTGLSEPTFYRMLRGGTVRDEQYYKLASALGVPVEPFLEAKREIVRPRDPFDTLAFVLTHELKLRPESCRRIMQLARECYATDNTERSRKTAA